MNRFFPHLDFKPDKIIFLISSGFFPANAFFIFLLCRDSDFLCT